MLMALDFGLDFRLRKSACKFGCSCYNSTVIFFRPVGQEVKTPPSQGGITGSIPVQAASRITELFL